LTSVEWDRVLDEAVNGGEGAGEEGGEGKASNRRESLKLSFPCVSSSSSEKWRVSLKETRFCTLGERRFVSDWERFRVCVREETKSEAP